MKNRNILIITLIIIVLALVYLKQKNSLTPKSKGGGYVKILPEKFTPLEVEKIKFYATGKEDKGIVMERDKEKQEEWRINSLFKAKGDKQNITNLLNDLSNLEGEERASVAGVFSDFDIGDPKAFHLVLYGQQDKELYHLLVGKSGPSFSDGFIRFKDTNNIFLVNKNFRSLFGVYNDKKDALDSKKWVQRRILNFQKEEITKLILHTPRKEIILEKQNSESNQPKKKENGEKEDQWRILKPKLKKSSLEKNRLNPLLSSLSNLWADELADPQKISEYGIKTSKNFIRITLKDKKEYAIILGKKKNKQYYLKREKENTIYLIDEYKQKNTFVKFEELIEQTK